MEEKIYELEESPHSSEAFYANVFLSKSALIIPYINCGFLEDVVNPRKDRAIYADFAYVVCLGLKYMKVQSGALLGRREDTEQIFHFGGYQLDVPADLIDIEVGCQSAHVILLPDSRLSGSFWIPVDSPKRNLDAETVADFFRGKRMPESIRRLMIQMTNRHGPPTT